MNDLISRQAAIDIIEREPFKGDALSEIEKLPSVQPEQRWIPVSERLPEDNIKVLVSTETAVGFASHDDIGWYIRHGYIHGYIDEIIAWMPLLEPYKAERDK